MAYNRGDSKQIIVGAAALFAADSVLAPNTYPALVPGESYKDTLTKYTETVGGQPVSPFRNVGYTMNGLEIVFQPDFGEVQVDQILDVAKLYKQGMQVNLNTAFAEATLENLLFAIAGADDTLGIEEATSDDPDSDDPAVTVPNKFAGQKVMNLSGGEIGECPVERGLIAVGPGTGDCELGSEKERIYVAYRALSIESVTVSAKRDEATMFEVSFRLLPEDASGSYGKIVDRTIPAQS
jgi:hypothetical protein